MFEDDPRLSFNQLVQLDQNLPQHLYLNFSPKSLCVFFLSYRALQNRTHFSILYLSLGLISLILLKWANFRSELALYKGWVFKAIGLDEVGAFPLV